MRNKVVQLSLFDTYTDVLNSMEENKSKSDIQLVECSKCHKKVASTEGVTKPSGFICNDCLKKKKRTLVLGGFCLSECGIFACVPLAIAVAVVEEACVVFSRFYIEEVGTLVLHPHLHDHLLIILQELHHCCGGSVGDEEEY